jgi:hypothetical protein
MLFLLFLLLLLFLSVNKESSSAVCEEVGRSTEEEEINVMLFCNKRGELEGPN